MSSLPSPEVWAVIPDFILYEASSHGNIRRIKTGRLVKPNTTQEYHTVVLYPVSYTHLTLPTILLV